MVVMPAIIGTGPPLILNDLAQDPLSKNEGPWVRP
jgi:hypothetical protein